MRYKMMITLGVVVASLLVSASAAAAPATWGAPGYHRVCAGETLFSIGRLYGVNPWSIASANSLSDPNKIYIGQWLYIPQSYYYPTHYYSYPPYGSGRYHPVAIGETLYSIGRMYGVNPWVIAAANGIYNLNYIYAGQRLLIPYHT